MELIFNSRRCPGSVVVYVEPSRPDEAPQPDLCFIAIFYKDKVKNHWDLIELAHGITMRDCGVVTTSENYGELKKRFIEHYTKYSIAQIKEAVAKGFDARMRHHKEKTEIKDS